MGKKEFWACLLHWIHVGLTVFLTILYIIYSVEGNFTFVLTSNILILMLCAFLYKERKIADGWKNIYFRLSHTEDQLKKYLEDCEKVEKQVKGTAQWLCTSLENQIKSYCEYKPEVTNMIIKAFPLEIKIGNDNLMVDIDYKEYYQDALKTLNEACEKLKESDD